TVVLSTLDRIKSILHGLSEAGQEPSGDDSDLIAELDRMASGAPKPHDAPAEPMLLDELALPVGESPAIVDESAAASPAADAALSEGAGTSTSPKSATDERPAGEANDKLAGHSIRVSVDT